jgi:hypothetical protein
MSESYICTWVATDRWGDWHENWNGLDKKVPAGKQVCCLSYLGHDTKHSLKDDAFFCYASARLMNFIWGAGYSLAQVKDDGPVRRLYGLTLGGPVSQEAVVDGVHFRRFANGLVAVNPTDREQTLAVQGDAPTSRLWDVYEEKPLSVERDGVRLILPPQSGRVYLYKPSPKDGLARGDHALTVTTEPGLGKTRFELDGLPMMTHGGRWTTEYVKGPNYGSFSARFDAPGWHTLRIVDDLRKEMLVANTYGDAYAINETSMPGAAAAPRDPSRLGKLMDPSEPGKAYEGKPYAFVGWDGAVKEKKKTVRVYVDGDTRILALFEKR